MAPELINEDSYDPSVDVYAFGMLAYEVVTLIEPFFENGKRISFFQLLENFSNGIRPEFNSIVPEKMVNLISRCWDQVPENRPSFESIYNELNEINLYSDYFNEDVDVDEINNYREFIEESNKKMKIN